MKTALIGYTGFVGSNIKKQKRFSDYYNSQNIEEIRGKTYDLIVSAANSSLMWKANLEPEKDWRNIKKYIDNIINVNAKHFVLISTIEVYENPFNVDEDTLIEQLTLKPYGKHRYKLEQAVRKQFKKHTIIRMPNLFGNNLKKNFLFDLIHNNRLDLIHKDNLQQWYNLENIWKDITIAMENNISTINFAVEPISCKKVAEHTMQFNFTNKTQIPPRMNNVLSKYASFYQSSTHYLYNKKETLDVLKKFVNKEKNKL